MCICSKDKVNQTDYRCTKCASNYHISCLKKQFKSLPTKRTFVCNNCKENTAEIPEIKPELQDENALAKVVNSAINPGCSISVEDIQEAISESKQESKLETVSGAKVINLEETKLDTTEIIELDSEPEVDQTQSTTNSQETKKRKIEHLDQEAFLLKMDQDITKLEQTPVKPSLEKKLKVLESISRLVPSSIPKKQTPKNSWIDDEDDCEVVDLTEKQLAHLRLKRLSKVPQIELELEDSAEEVEDVEESAGGDEESDSEVEWMNRITNYSENSLLNSNVAADVTKAIMDNIPTDAVVNRSLKEIKAELIQQHGGNGTPRALSITLMEHQIHGLAWMMHMEKNEKIRGGILADDMGLGKTIQTLALLHQNRLHPNSENAGTLIVAPLALIHQWKREILEKSRTKLRVQVHHGSDRIKDKKDLRKFDVVVTTYSVLHLDAPVQRNELADGTIVPGKRPGVLFTAGFQRVILDEAHIIKNRKSGISNAAQDLDAKYRFSLTGTPLQNSVDDIYSQLRFLRVPIWDNYHNFYMKITTNIKKEDMQKSKVAIHQLQAILRSCLLRRTKDTKGATGAPIIRLVDRLVEIEKITLGPAERQFYDIISNKANSEFDHIMGAARGMFNYSSILVLLLRLRQAASHPHLIKEVFEDAQFGNFALNFMQYSRGNLREIDGGSSLLDFIAANESPALAEAKRKLSNTVFESIMESARTGELIYQSCLLCSDVMTTPRVAYCGHTFCNDCIQSYLQTVQFSDEEESTELIPIEAFAPSRTPRNTVNRPISDAEEALEDVLEQLHPDRDFHSWITSSKVDKMIDILQKIRIESRAARSNGDSPIKTVVFSQWTSFMDIAQRALNANGFKYVRYDGTMSSEEREKAIHNFMTDKSITIAFVSLKCGGVGLNLTAASRVILLDLWWNPSVEDQAIDRVHRIGQTKEVKVYRLAVDDSVEDRILVLQDQKRALADGALGHGEFKLPRLTREDLRFLFRPSRQRTIDTPRTD
ncbi:hypothetical protein HDV01_004245 [Terramyces sp. JEL0728]|nr:hypothetical protein HDV01_004245 [Terramyces sp. JEL0728]